MEKVKENRTIVCRYQNRKKTIKEQEVFGWTVQSQIILNRFGSPLPTDTRLPENVLIAQCSVQLELVREVEQDKIVRLNSLQTEHDMNREIVGGFGGGRVTGIVFLHIAAFIAFLFSSFYSVTGVKAVFITLGVFALGGIIALFTTGFVRVGRVSKTNNERRNRKLEIESEAKKLLEE